MTSPRLIALAAATCLATPALAETPADPGRAQFRELYKELVEINTTLSVGSCTQAVQAMGARLKAAGYADADLHYITPEKLPKQGNLVAILPGRDPRAKGVLLMAHVDVVEAKREDWKRDPFTLVEEGGYFYARGASDDKAMAAVITDTMIRYKKEGYKPRRPIKLMLTCGEETYSVYDGAQHLARDHAKLIEADIALNEGGGGVLDDQDRRIALNIQAGEKGYMDYALEVTNPGGHSSAPPAENAIYRLSSALLKVGAYSFPYRLTDATRLNFERMAPLKTGPIAADLRAASQTPPDQAALDRLAAIPEYAGLVHTTCVATMSEAGHAPNALPQRARANVNCRIMPGESVASTREALVAAIADPQVAVTLAAAEDPTPIAPPVTPRVLGPVTTAAAKIWPGVPIIPRLSAGATDSMYTNAIGIPSYGLSGIFKRDGSMGVHGLDEHISVRSVYESRDFMYEVVKLYADQK